MSRFVFLIYGVTCHVLFLFTYAYLAGFVGHLGVPKSIDSGQSLPVLYAAIVNMALLGLFAAQHSVMARPAFKRVWTRVIPAPIERSTYVLCSNLVLWILMWQWQAMPAIVWDVRSTFGRTILWSLFGLGWLAVPAVSLMINHWDLFGIRQVWLHWRREPYVPLAFRVPAIYGLVRHPLYLGWMLAFWATPRMTVGHLLFAGVQTVYMVLAAILEERDLVAHFGRDYLLYQRRVGMFLPRRPRPWDRDPSECPPSVSVSGQDGNLSHSRG